MMPTGYPEPGQPNTFIPGFQQEPEWIEGVNCWSRGPEFALNSYVTHVEEPRMNLRPLGDRVIVEPEKMAEKIGTIHLPDSAQSNSQRGTVVAVGPGKMLDSGVLVPMQVKVGDLVAYGWGGKTVTENGKDKYLSLSEDDILAVIE